MSEEGIDAMQPMETKHMILMLFITLLVILGIYFLATVIGRSP